MFSQYSYLKLHNLVRRCSSLSSLILDVHFLPGQGKGFFFSIRLYDIAYAKTELIEVNAKKSGERIGSKTYLPTDKEPDSFDKALESVEEALIKLEDLLHELHVSSSNSGKEHLKAACSDLERIRKLKKEAEFLEASFRAKAASLQQGDDDNGASSVGEQRQYSNGKNRKSNVVMDRSTRAANSLGLWNFLVRNPTRAANSLIYLS